MSALQDFAAIRNSRGEAAAVAAIESRATAGDPDAQHLVGEWRLWGAFGPQNLTDGYAWVLAAAKQGDVSATLTLAALVATGTGLPANPATARLIVEGMAPRSPQAAEQVRVSATLPPSIAPRTVLRADPYVARIDGLLSDELCRYLIARATPKLQPSTIVGANGEKLPSPLRDSYGTNFAPIEEDLAVHTINQRIAAATETAVDQGEPLHVLRYEPGQQYRPHLDALPGVANQRVLTCLVYLNEEFEGGETAFGDSLRVRGGTGDAILFANTTPDGRADQRTRHAGLPVTQGVKWLATRWIRGARFHPWEPATTR